MKHNHNSQSSSAVDRALAESLLNNPEPNTTQLELRILKKTASLQQLHKPLAQLHKPLAGASRSQNAAPSRGFRWLITSGLVSSFATLAAVWFVVVSMTAPVTNSPSDNAIYLASSAVDAELLNDTELELVEASDLVWDELILLEDELAFASL